MKKETLGNLLASSGQKRAGDQDLPILSVTMHDGLVDQSEKFKKRIASTDTSTYRIVHKNELVVGFPIDEGVLGFQSKYPAAIVSPAYGIWKLRKPNETFIPFVEGYLRSDEARKVYASKMRGGVARRRTLSRQDFLGLEIHFPPLDEQKRIAAVLDKADALRRQRQESLQLTEDLLQSVFIDMFGDLGANPKGWPLIPFGDIVTNTFRNGLSPSNKGKIPGRVLTLTSITGGKFDSSFARDASFDKAPTKKQTLSKDTFLICRGNGNKNLVGVGVFPTEDYPEICFPDTMIGSNPPRNIVLPNFLQYAWKSRHVRNQIESASRTANGTYKINQTALTEVLLALPPIPLQQQFSEVYENASKLQKHFSEQSIEAENLFSSLQQRAFRGELNLRRVQVSELTYEQSLQPPEEEGDIIRDCSFPSFGKFIPSHPALTIPANIRKRLKVLDEEFAQGELIDWSPDFFRYRVIRERVNRPFTFEELMIISGTIFYDTPPYEEAKAIVFEMLESKQLEQSFDDQPNRRSVVLDLAR